MDHGRDQDEVVWTTEIGVAVPVEVGLDDLEPVAVAQLLRQLARDA